MKSLFILLAIYQLKHFIADFPLQGQFMLGKFSPDKKVWIPALLAHAGVHAGLTFLIAFGYSRNLGISAGLSVYDFVIHFTVDRIKASPSILGRWKADRKEFWWTLGADQMIHHLTHYSIIWFLVNGF